jgi:hypothetical protein
VKTAGWLTIHFWLTLFWTLPASAGAWYVVYVMEERHAAFAILLVSNYANFVGHWAAWQAARAEKSADDAR